LSRPIRCRRPERCLSHLVVAKAVHALSAVNIAAMGGSHPLAKRIGAWLAVAAPASP
jgi:hypothetical protein